MKQTDRQWIEGFFDGYKSGQLSLLDLIKQKIESDQVYVSSNGEKLPWEDETVDTDNS